MSTHRILQQLTGGDRRSIGKANLVVAQVLRDPALFKPLFTGFTHPDPLVRMRSADAVEKITATHPEYLKPHKNELLTTLTESQQPEVRWHVAALIARLDLTEPQQQRALQVLLGYTSDESAIVKTMAMQALGDLGLRYPALKPVALKHIRDLTATGTPAMKARGRKLLLTLTEA
jgi:HEAT repeat protein